MKQARWPRGFTGSKGFTLIETVMVVVVLGIASVAIVTLQGNMFSGQSDNQDILVGAQRLQECAEKVLAIRRNSSSGYTAVTTTACNDLGTYGGFLAPQVTLALTGDATSPVTACTKASTACTATIKISKDGTNYLAPMTLRLSNY